MRNLENTKSDIFKTILISIDKEIRLIDKREAMLVSLTFEKTFTLLNKRIDAELRKSYMKKSKNKKSSPSSRLDSIK